MQVPRLEKIVLNCGVGRATQQQSLLDGGLRSHRDHGPEAARDPRPQVDRRSSSEGRDQRQGQLGWPDVEFYDRSSVSPSPYPHFRSMNPVVRRSGNYTFSVRTVDLPGDRLRRHRLRARDGHQIVTTSRTDDEGRHCSALGFRSRDAPSSRHRRQKKAAARSSSASFQVQGAADSGAKGAAARVPVQAVRVCRIASDAGPSRRSARARPGDGPGDGAGEGRVAAHDDRPIADMLRASATPTLASRRRVSGSSSDAVRLRRVIHPALDHDGIARCDLRLDLRVELAPRPEAVDIYEELNVAPEPTQQRISKATDVPRVLGGMGISILSTNQGLMTDREARKRRVGGEILCQVW